MFARGARRLVRSAQSMVSQVIVSVTAAVCVAVITNAYLGSGGETNAAATTGNPAVEERSLVNASARSTELPPLEVEFVRDVPNAAEPGQEIFPGVPAGISPQELQQSVKAEDKKARRRFLGIPIPFTSTASDVAEEDVKGG